MKCAEFESIVADYLDGTLGETERAAVEQHASSCGACREFLEEVSGAVAFLGRAEEVLPPPELVTRLAYLAPVGRTRRPFERQGLFSRLTTQWLQPILQPRLVMGMAMTVLSFAMLERCTGVRVQHIQPSDLSPARVWDGVEDKALRVKDRAVKYYENVRLVYEIETRLKDLEADQQGTDAAPGADTAKKPDAGTQGGDQK